MVESNPRVTARKKESNPDPFGEVTIGTVNRGIAAQGYTSHCPVKKLLPTLKQRRNQVAFAHKYSGWNIDTWLSVLWNGESTFRVNDSRGGNVCRRSGSDPHDPRYIQAYGVQFLITVLLSIKCFLKKQTMNK